MLCVQQPNLKCRLSYSVGVNFINILNTNFSYECHFVSFLYVHVTREKLPKQRLYEKFVRKMLMKLTIGKFCIKICSTRFRTLNNCIYDMLS